MNTSERILEGIKQALTEGEAKVNLFEEHAFIRWWDICQKNRDLTYVILC